MKKILCSLFLVLTLCACTTKTEKITPVTKGITFFAEITYYNETYECNTEIKQNGDTTVTFSYPQDLSPLTIAYQGGEVTANYDGLEYSYSADGMPHYSVSDVIYDVFSQNFDTVFEEDDNYYVEYRKDGNDVRLYIGSSGLPIKIESNFFTVTIKNATIIK